MNLESPLVPNSPDPQASGLRTRVTGVIGVIRGPTSKALGQFEWIYGVKYKPPRRVVC